MDRRGDDVAGAMGRRGALAALLGAAACAVACKHVAEDRCQYCGMTIAPNSAWTAELTTADGVVHRFDAPKCALLAWRKGRVAATSSRFQEFYERAWRDGAELRFALGSDVVAPMGGDAVPVAPERAAKFASDHVAARVVSLGELTTDVLEAL